MGVATEVDSPVVAALNGAEGPVSSILFQGFKTYESAKNMALESKRIGKTVAPAVEFFEGTFSKATKLSPLKVEKVVEALDSSVDSALKYGKDTQDKVVSTVKVVGAKPIQLKNSTLTTIHTSLEKYIEEKEEDEEKVITEEEMGFKIIFEDMSSLTSQGANKILDVSETYVEEYLHEDEDEEGTGIVPGFDSSGKPVTTRVFELSKVVSKRMQKRAFTGLDSLKLRTQEVTHIDLVKYSKMLDSTKGNVISVFETKVAEPTRKYREVAAVKAGEAKEVITKKAIDAKEIADKYQQVAKERIYSIKVPFTDKDVLFYVTVVSETTDKKIVKPLEEIIETFKKDFEVETKKEQDPDKPLTIEAGLRALIAAVRYRATIIFQKETAEKEADSSSFHDASEE